MGIDSATIDLSTKRLFDSENVARALADVPRPFVLINSRGLSVLRRGLSKPGWKRSLYQQDVVENASHIPGVSGAGLLARAADSLRGEIRIPGRAGRRDDFFCDDGVQLQAGFNGAYSCPSCGRGYTGEKYDCGARWFEHNKLASDCLAAALVYQLSRGEEYALRAAEILLRYADNYSTLHADSTADGAFQRSLDEAVWVIPLAQAYDLICEHKTFTKETCEWIENHLLKRVAVRLGSIHTDSESESWRIAAVGVIGCAIKDVDFVSLAIDWFHHHISEGLGEDGLWLDSPYYHFYALRAFVTLAEAAMRIGIDLYNLEPVSGKSLKTMFLAPIQIAFPSLQLPALDDGGYLTTLPFDLYELACRRWADPAFTWVLNTGYGFVDAPKSDLHRDKPELFARSSLYALLFGRGLLGRVLPPRTRSKNYPSLGTTILRSRAGMMLTLRRRRGPVHDHLDRHGITLYANDRVVMPDFGSPVDGADLTDYYRSTGAHNTVVVNGASQCGDSDSNLFRMDDGDFLQYVESECETYPGVFHTRRIIMADDVVIVCDDLRGETERTYDCIFRCEGTLDPIPSAAAPSVSFSEHCENVRSLGRGELFHVKWSNEDGGLSACFASDVEAELFAADVPAETAARKTPAVCFRADDRRVRYISVFAPFRSTAPVIELCSGSCKVIGENATTWIYLSDGCGEACGAEIDTNAEVAAVRKSGGSLIALGAINGGRLALNGSTLLECDGFFERVDVRFDGKHPAINFSAPGGKYLHVKSHSRVLRVNGHRVSAATRNKLASIRLTGALADN